MAMITPRRLNSRGIGVSVAPIQIRKRLTRPLFCRSTIQAAMRTSTEVQKGSSTRMSSTLALRAESVLSQ
ncbi:hypothetical protein FQZ97_899190 [compost metagenome]